MPRRSADVLPRTAHPSESMIEPSLSIVIPVYREIPRLAESIRQIAAFSKARNGLATEVVFVDDGSPDNTAEVLAGFIRENGLVDAKILSYPVNRGKGYAVKRGVEAATGAYILMSDVDCSAPLSEWTKLKTALDAGADFACGSRTAPGAHIGVPPPLHRRILSRLFHLLVYAAGVRGIHDTQCGFKLFKAAPAKEVFNRLRIERFAFDVEMIAVARELGYTVVEIPVQWDYSGSSTVHVVSHGARMLWDLFRICLRRKTGKGR